VALARILQTCDAAVEVLLGEWSEPGKDDGVLRAYAPPINLSDDVEPVHVGRKIYLFPAPYSAALLTRGDQWRSYLVRALMVERYVDDADGPPDKWIDERITFFEQNVFNLLVDPDLELLGAIVPALDQEATVDLLYDADLLLKRRTFWCYGTFPFAEDTDLTGASP
jgi:hypothetical protein